MGRSRSDAGRGEGFAAWSLLHHRWEPRGARGTPAPQLLSCPKRRRRTQGGFPCSGEPQNCAGAAPGTGFCPAAPGGGLFCPLWCVLGWGRMVLGGPARGSCIPLPPSPRGQHPMQHSRRHGPSVPTAVPPPQPQGQPSPLPLPWDVPRASGTRSRDAALAASQGPQPSAICSGAGGRAVLTSCWSQGTCELRQRPEKSLR